MKERIKELMDQAGIDIDAVEGQGQMPTAVLFASLIIKECGILTDMYNRECHLKNINPTQITGYEFITRHFGVE